MDLEEKQQDTATLGRDDTATLGRVDPRGAAARDLAIKRLQRKRKVIGDAVAYVVINLFLIGVWAFTGRHYFWPAWVLAGWGFALVLDVWNAYFRRPISEADIAREMQDR